MRAYNWQNYHRLSAANPLQYADTVVFPSSSAHLVRDGYGETLFLMNIRDENSTYFKQLFGSYEEALIQVPILCPFIKPTVLAASMRNASWLELTAGEQTELVYVLFQQAMKIHGPRISKRLRSAVYAKQLRDFTKPTHLCQTL